MSEHAILAPSSAHRWTTCVGSLARELNRPNRSSEFADEGTAAHEVAAMCLKSNTNAAAYAGRMIEVKDAEMELVSSWEVNDEMQDAVQTYIEAIRRYARGKLLFVEERVDLSHTLQFVGQFGTADSPIIDLDNFELQAHDLKYGKGVRVEAEENEQLMSYALGLYDFYSLCYEIKRVRLVIHQPRLNHLSEWVCSVEDLLAFRVKLRARAKITMAVRQMVLEGKISRDDLPLSLFMPDEDNCRFCKASGDCKAQDAAVSAAIGAPVGKTLSEQMDKVAMVRSWCKAKEAETLSTMLRQEKVPGWKIVEGRKGDREFTDESKAERIMAAVLPPEELHKKELISVAKAEKLLAKPSPETWARLKLLVTQSEGKPSVARDTDARTAIKVKSLTDVFEVLA